MNPLSACLAAFLDQRDRWFLWLPAFIAGGIVLYFALPFEPPLAFLASAPLLTLLLFSLRHRPVFLPFLAVLLALTLGFNAAQLETFSLATPLLNEKLPPTGVTGWLVRAETMPGGVRLTLRDPVIRKAPKAALRSIRMKVRTTFDALPPPGARINLWGPLWPPGESVVPGGYDFRRSAFFKQIGASGFSLGELRVYETTDKPPFFWTGFHLFFEKARRFLTAQTFARLPADEAPMTAALLTGNQSSIDSDVMRAMRLSGLSHLLSISGVHVSMISLLLYVPLRALLALFPWIALRWPIKKIAAALAIGGTCLYTLLVGSDAPTVRSAMMTSLVLFAIIVDRKAMSLRLVALAATLIMLAAPSGAIGPSFQMSFAAVLAMVAAYEKEIDAALQDHTPFVLPAWISGLWRHSKDIILTSLIATAATTPFTLYHFQTFSFYGVFSNMIAIPLTTFWVMPCLLLTYLAAPFGAAGWFLDGAGWGVGLTIRLAETVAAWPYAQFFMPPMPLWAFGLVIVGGLWVCLWRQKFRWLGVVPIVIACFYPLTVTLPSILIAPDGASWAIRLEEHKLAAFGQRRDNYAIYQWRQRLENPDVLFYSPRKLPAKTKALACTKELCRYERGSFVMLFLWPDASPQTIHTACNSQPSAIMAPFALPDCAGSIVIDQTALAARGAHSITFTPTGPAVEVARTRPGERPWSVGWTTER